MTAAAGIVAVSPRYIEALQRRYAAANLAWVAPERHAVIPFAGREADLAEARNDARICVAREKHEIVLCYVGAGGAIMQRSFELICRALSTLRKEGSALANRVRIELFGTTYDWKSGDPKQLEATARLAGVSALVREDPERVSYRRSLVLLVESDGAIILGVDDAGYMPSKLFGYALSGKPLLASLRRDGPAYAQFEAMPGLGHALWFDRDDAMPIADATPIVDEFLQEAAARRSFDRRAAVEPFLAPNMAARHVQLFDACVALPADGSVGRGR